MSDIERSLKQLALDVCRWSKGLLATVFNRRGPSTC